MSFVRPVQRSVAAASTPTDEPGRVAGHIVPNSVILSAAKNPVHSQTNPRSSLPVSCLGFNGGPVS
jgi:hypothetical protein